MQRRSSFTTIENRRQSVIPSRTVRPLVFRYRGLLLLLLGLASCESEQASKSTGPPVHPAPPSSVSQNPLPQSFKFSFYISGSGNEDVSDTGTKPYDSWTLDTTGELNVRVSRRISLQNHATQSGLAALDRPDMDSLRFFIRQGHLFEIDSSNLNQQCASVEHYTVRIVPLEADVKPVGLSFDACATDYNLLLQPQRRYFKRFIEWWERMRVKYRPGP